MNPSYWIDLPMGLERRITFTGRAVPTWSAIQVHLSHVCISSSLRMIDGLPAFPEELPGDSWRELRLATSEGMMTLRRNEDQLACVIWGNAAPALEADWHKLIWACAAAGNGQIEIPEGVVSSEEYARSLGFWPEQSV
jgi:hypothetical protein